MKPQAVLCSAAATFMLAVSGPCLAAESPGAEEAKVLLDKAVTYFERNGTGVLRIQR